MHHHTGRSFVDEFRWVSPLHYLKTRWQTLFFFGARCKRGRHLYTTTAPSCCIPASYCHLSATLQTMSIIFVNLQDNRALFRLYIALLRFSFDSPSYITKEYNPSMHNSPTLDPRSPVHVACYYPAQNIDLFEVVLYFLHYNCDHTISHYFNLTQHCFISERHFYE